MGKTYLNSSSHTKCFFFKGLYSFKFFRQFGYFWHITEIKLKKSWVLGVFYNNWLIKIIKPLAVVEKKIHKHISKLKNHPRFFKPCHSLKSELAKSPLPHFSKKIHIVHHSPPPVVRKTPPPPGIMICEERHTSQVEISCLFLTSFLYSILRGKNWNKKILYYNPYSTSQCVICWKCLVIFSFSNV